MHRRVAAILTFSLLALASCSPGGKLRNPFVAHPPFVPSAVPLDFAIIVDEQHNTFYTRQHIQQVIIAADSLSRTTYTTLREFNNTPAEPYSQSTPLTPSQVQAMWNAVSQYELMDGAVLFVNWHSGADFYKENTYTIQIRANGQTNSYRQVNGFPSNVRPLIVLVDAVRLPMSRDALTPVVGSEAPMPLPPALTEPATQPATEPAATLPAPAPTP